MPKQASYKIYSSKEQLTVGTATLLHNIKTFMKMNILIIGNEVFW